MIKINEEALFLYYYTITQTTTSSNNLVSKAMSMSKLLKLLQYSSAAEDLTGGATSGTISCNSTTILVVDVSNLVGAVAGIQRASEEVGFFKSGEPRDTNC